ncbi:YfbK domain-containing protein [Luteolibacter marinus]|uniref:YfbK domain-containing protein n=1 Tax=Luteolibacter marinus TaxID=2776705 RepID=UPI0018691868|nr:von Willebrand factor type A domain-containing protein [Luteolibacter marinus]
MEQRPEIAAQQPPVTAAPAAKQLAPDALAAADEPAIRSRSAIRRKDMSLDLGLQPPAESPAEAADGLSSLAKRTSGDFISPGEGGVAGDVDASTIVTGGLRSGDGAITRNDIDAILNNPDRRPELKAKDGISSFTGVFFQDEGLKRGPRDPGPAMLRVNSGGGGYHQPRNESRSGEFLEMGEVAKDLGDSRFGDDSVVMAGGPRWFADYGYTSESTDSATSDSNGIRMLNGRGVAELSQASDAFEGSKDRSWFGRQAGEASQFGMKSTLDGFSNESAATENESDLRVPQVMDVPVESGLVVPDHVALPWGASIDSVGETAFAINPTGRILDATAGSSGSGAPPLQQEKEDQIRNNPAVVYPVENQVDEVRRKLYLAEGNYDLGKFDEAHKAYQETLQIDPYNKAARRGLEKVETARADYYRAAYDHTRAELLAQVDKAWELSVPPLVDEGKDSSSPMTAEGVTPPTELAALLDFTGASPETEQQGDSGSAQKESLRRQNAVAESDRLRDEGRAAYADGKYPEAYRRYVEAIQLLPETEALDDRREFMKLSLKDASEALSIKAERLGEKELSSKWKAKGQEWAPEKEVVVEPMAETETATEPFSTFSLHVSDASFKLATAAMERGEVPAAESIRPEEFYNAFDYGDAAPANGEPVVCAVEQSAHPAFPRRNLLRIGVRTGSQGRGQSTPLNLTLLLDNSGSMERDDRQAGLTMAVQQLSGLLQAGDTVSVVGFSRQPHLLVDRLPGDRAQELNRLVAQTPSEGGTNLEEGLKLGGELALRQFDPAAQNRVVLFTDGAANLGDAEPETLQKKIEELRQQGVAFDAAGFGADGLNDRLLERLTRNGNGRYYVVDQPGDADANFAKQLAGAFRPAAENVKVQVRFNPARVGKYKLIGFEEHRLNKEDFRNDAVDAAEMAAEEAGNALYQIEVLPDGEGEVGEVSVRFRDVASGQMVERTWTIPYEAQAPAFDQAAPSIQLAGLAAFAAEKLRGAPMADAVDFQQLGESLAKVKARYPNSRPVADLATMMGKLK